MENEKTIEAFTFEIYTKNPLTGETGWDIKFVRAFGETKAEARNWLENTFPNFDCEIASTEHWNGTNLSPEDVEAYARGENWREIDESLVLPSEQKAHVSETCVFFVLSRFPLRFSIPCILTDRFQVVKW